MIFMAGIAPCLQYGWFCLDNPNTEQQVVKLTTADSQEGTSLEIAAGNQRAVSLLFGIAALLIGIFVRSAITTIGSYLVVEDPTIAGVATRSALVAVMTGVISFFVLLRQQKATDFLDSVVAELKKVAWPSREETINNTVIVIGATIFFASLLAVYDFTWAKLTGLVLYSS